MVAWKADPYDLNGKMKGGGWTGDGEGNGGWDGGSGRTRTEKWKKVARLAAENEGKKEMVAGMANPDEPERKNGRKWLG